MRSAFVVVLLLAACGGAPHTVVVGHKDLGGDGGPGDMAVPAGDFATLPLDMRVWTDETSHDDLGGSTFVPDGGELSGVWNNDSTAIAVGDYGTVLRKDRGGAWTADTSAKPSGVALVATGGRGTTDAYALGVGGALWKYSGAEWTGAWMPDSPPTNDTFRSIWVAPDGMAFAEGDMSIIMRVGNGSFNWTAINGAPSASEYPQGVFGLVTGANRYSLYVVGCSFTSTSCNAGKIWHADITYTAPSTVMGATVVAQDPSPTDCLLAYGMWAASTTDLYVVCDNGHILHSTGDGNWVAQHSGLGSGNHLYAISGVGADEIYAVGEVDGNGVPIVVHKYDHAVDTWTRDAVPTSIHGSALFSVYATPYDVYAVGAHGVVIHK